MSATLIKQYGQKYLVELDKDRFEYLMGSQKKTNNGKQTISPEKAQLLKKSIKDAKQSNVSFTNSKDLLTHLRS